MSQNDTLDFVQEFVRRIGSEAETTRTAIGQFQSK